MQLKRVHYPVIVAVTHVKELNTIETIDGGMRFGASVTLTRLSQTLQQAIGQLHGEFAIYATRVLTCNGGRKGRILAIAPLT